MPKSGSKNDLEVAQFTAGRFLPITATSGDNELVPAQSGWKILVLSGLLISSAGATVKFQSATTTDLTGPLPLIASTGFIIAETKTGSFETKVGEKLNLNVSAAATVGGWLVYMLVTS